MMTTLEAIDFEISCAETHRQALDISVPFMDPYSSHYTLLYKKWEYCDI